MLREAGVEVEENMATGMPRGYYEYGLGANQDSSFLPDDIIALMSSGAINKAAQEALDFIDSKYIR